MFCYTTRHRAKISDGNWMSKKSFLIIILDSARYAQTFNTTHKPSRPHSGVQTMILARWPVKNGMFCYTTRQKYWTVIECQKKFSNYYSWQCTVCPNIQYYTQTFQTTLRSLDDDISEMTHQKWHYWTVIECQKKRFLIIILDSAQYARTFNIIPNVKHHPTACPGSLVSLGYISLTSLLNVRIAVCKMSRQNSVLSRSSLYLCSSHSSPSMHSITSSTMSSVKKAAKTVKSIAKSVKRAIKKGAATAVHPLKKAQTSLSSRASSVDMFGALFLSWWLTIFWFISLEGNDKRPSSSQEDNAEDEPEGETDEQELGAYKLTFTIFLASDPMWL